VNKKKQKNFFVLGHGRDFANAHAPESKSFCAGGAQPLFSKSGCFTLT
jgi:hypothetical protein